MTDATPINPKIAPQDIDAERSVLGGIMLTNDAIYDVIELLGDGAAFYREPHRKVFAAMLDLVSRNEPIDLITVSDELRNKGELEDAGGRAYVASLDSAVPLAANLMRYAKIVKDKYIARRLIEAGSAIARDGYEQASDIDEMIDGAEQKIFAVTDTKASSLFVPLSVSVKRVFAALEARFDKQSDVTGIASGFIDLDKMTAGFQRQDLIIIAGRPSSGKSSIVMNIAAHIAIELKLPVAVFSLEMCADSLTTRLFSSDARIDGNRMRTGKMDDSDWPKLARSADKMFRAPMFIDESSAASVMEMRAKCRRLKAKHGNLGMVVIDYMQLMRGRAGADNREQEVSEISRGLKAMAKELDVPVIALSQLNRGLERREDKRPMLSDLRESGAIEQDADVIAFVYRDEVYNPTTTKDAGIAEIIIGKQRTGATGTVRLAFQKEFTRFDNLANEGRRQ